MSKIAYNVSQMRLNKGMLIYMKVGKMSKEECIVLKDWIVVSYYGSEEDLLKEPSFQRLKLLWEHLLEVGWCHVKLKGGDYDGSIAKFTVDVNPYVSKGIYRRNHFSTNRTAYNFSSIFYGKLSWGGKRNNPSFKLSPESIHEVYLNYIGDEVFKRVDFNKVKEDLLKSEVHDIDGNVLNVGDEVLYLNLRYGKGGKLSHGVIKEFKANARQGYLSVIVFNDKREESELNYPYDQIYKKPKT